MNENEVLGLEVKLKDRSAFLIVAETLTRIGIPSGGKLFQSCHLLHKKGRYFVVHFKELLSLDRLKVDFTNDDVSRRNTIAQMLESWGLLAIVDGSDRMTVPKNTIKVVRSSEVGDWQLVPKYRIGKRK